MANKEETKQQAEAEAHRIFEHALYHVYNLRIKGGESVSEAVRMKYGTVDDRARFITDQSFAMQLAGYLIEKAASVTEVNLLAIDGLGRIGRFKDHPRELTTAVADRYIAQALAKNNRFKFLLLFLPKM